MKILQGEDQRYGDRVSERRVGWQPSNRRVVKNRRQSWPGAGRRARNANNEKVIPCICSCLEFWKTHHPECPCKH
jgi:hypothetical protein